MGVHRKGKRPAKRYADKRVRRTIKPRNKAAGRAKALASLKRYYLALERYHKAKETYKETHQDYDKLKEIRKEIHRNYHIEYKIPKPPSRWIEWYAKKMVSALENYLETRTDKAYDTFREYKRILYRKYKLTYEQVYALLKHLKQFIPIHLIAKLS